MKKMNNKKGMMLLGVVGAGLIGAGMYTYKRVLSPRTKRKMASLEEDMYDDFENMM